MYIYTLAEPETLKVRYVGITNDMTKRFRDHMNSVYKNNSNNWKKNWIKKLVNNGQKPVMELLEECDNEDVECFERMYISLFKSWGFKLVNSTNGGEKSKIFSQEVRDKIRKTLTGRKVPKEVTAKWKSRKGVPRPRIKEKVYTDEERKRMSIRQMGRRHPEYVKQKISDAQKGEKNHRYGKKDTSERLEQKRKHGIKSAADPLIKEKISKSLKNTYKTTDYLENVKRGLKKKNDEIDPITGETHLEKRKKAISHQFKQLWANPEFRQRMIEGRRKNRIKNQLSLF